MGRRPLPAGGGGGMRTDRVPSMATWLPSPTNLARLGHFPPASQAGPPCRHGVPCMLHGSGRRLVSHSRRFTPSVSRGPGGTLAEGGVRAQVGGGAQVGKGGRRWWGRGVRSDKRNQEHHIKYIIWVSGT